MTVLIGQADSLQGHEHEYWVSGYNNAGNVTPYIYSAAGSAGARELNTTRNIIIKNAIGKPVTETGYGNVRIDNETRAMNITIRYWKRTA